jgi:hypothetical protein
MSNVRASRHKALAFAWLAVVMLDCGCGGGTQGASTAPTSTGSGPPIPLPNGNVSGRIENLETAADLITYNQRPGIPFVLDVDVSAIGCA